MAFDVSCCLRWTIYILAGLTVILAIATITLDQSDNDEQKDGAVSGTGKAYTNKTGSNIVLFVLMLASAGCALGHLIYPRLWLLALGALIGNIFFILRLFLPNHIHFELIFTVPLLAGCSICYIYWAGFHEKTDKDETIWRTMTKNDVKKDAKKDSHTKLHAGSSVKLHKPSSKNNKQVTGTKGHDKKTDG